MKLQELIDNIDISQDCNKLNLDRLSNEFDIHDYIDDIEQRVKSYYITKWLCTDSYVGVQAYFLDYVGDQAYFLDGEFVCIGSQLGRKSDENFAWVSKEKFNKTQKYLLSLVEKQYDTSPVLLESDDLQKDIGEGFHISYSSQFLTTDVICSKTKEPVVIIDRFLEDCVSKKLKIQYKDGTTKDVDTCDVIVPFLN